MFGAEEPPQPELPAPPAAADRAGREAPRPLPRPGLAGGTRSCGVTDPTAQGLSQARRAAQSDLSLR